MRRRLPGRLLRARPRQRRGRRNIVSKKRQITFIKNLIKYTTAADDNDLLAILKLQQSNLKSAISTQEARQQGFVTVVHNLELLQTMNKLEPQFIAKKGDELIGYALSMHASLGDNISVLQPMFEKINQLNFKGFTITKKNYVVMGQVCIAKSCRGQSVFSKLYENMFATMRSRYKFIITEISLNNPRSIRAHQKAGFEELFNYKDETDHWSTVIKVL